MTPDQLIEIIDTAMIKFFVIILAGFIVYWFINKISYRGDGK